MILFFQQQSFETDLPGDIWGKKRSLKEVIILLENLSEQGLGKNKDYM